MITTVDGIHYRAEDVIYRDLGLDVIAVWTADPQIAHQLKTGDADTFNRIITDHTLDIVEVVASIQRVRKSDGYTHTGWLLDLNDGAPDPVGTRKTEAIAQLREAVAGYFNR